MNNSIEATAYKWLLTCANGYLLVQMPQRIIDHVYVHQLMTDHLLLHSCKLQMQCVCRHCRQCSHPVSVHHQPTYMQSAQSYRESFSHTCRTEYH